MATKRRFRITYDDAQLIILALDRAIEALNDKSFDDEYWKMTQSRMNLLRNNLLNYNWYKED